MRSVLPANLALAVLAITARAADPADDAREPPLARRVPPVRFRGEPFELAVRQAQLLTDSNLWVQPAALAAVGVTPNTPVTYVGRPRVTATLLAGMLDAAAGGPGRATYGCVGGTIVLTTPGGLQWLGVTAARHRAAHEPPGIVGPMRGTTSFRAISLTDALDTLEAVGGLQIHVDRTSIHAAHIAANAPLDILLRRPSVADVLTVVLGSAGTPDDPLDYRVEPDGSVTVSTAAALAGGH